MIALVGRERETAQVEALVDRIRERGDALVLRGAPGIGKSALLAVASEWARAHEVAVSSTSGVQSETHLPFAGLYQLVQPLLGAADELPARQREALLGAFGMEDAAAPEPFLIALAVLNLFGDAAARRPLLIVVDDVQWLDRSTTEVLGFVARRVRSEPIALLLAVRDGYATSLDDSDLTELALDGLAPAAAEALLDAQSPALPVGMRWRVLSEAAGNPLALVELPLALDSGAATTNAEFLPLTARLERAFAARLAALPPPTKALLLVSAANDGPDLSAALLAGAAVTGTELTAEALAPAVEAGLVELREPGIQFRHPLVRSAVYQKAGPADRLAAHRALATVHAADPDRRTWHRAAAIARQDESVAAELEEVAARARRRGAITVAVAALRRAAEVSEDPPVRAERLLRAAELAFELGRRDQVAALLALVEPALLGRPQRARLAWLGEVLEEGRNEGPERILRLIAYAETMESAGDPTLALNFARAAALRCWWTDSGRDLRRRVMALAERLASSGDDPELLLILATVTPVESGGAIIDRLTKLRDARFDAAMARFLGVAGTAVGAHDLAGHFLDACISDARAQGRLGLLAQALGSQMWSRLFCGDWQSALLAAEEGERLARETAQPRWQSSACAALALLAGLRGEEERGLALAAQAERVLGSGANSSTMAIVEHARGVIALCAGRHEEAFGRLRRLFDPDDAVYHPMWRLWAIIDLTEAAIPERREAVRAVLAELEEVGARTPAPLLHVGLRHARAVLADDADAGPLYQDALNADLSPWPTARARLLLAHGVWLRRRRRIQEARVPLRTARDAFDALGLLAFGEKARQELRAAGEASDLRLPSSVDQLTAQELHIARLAAAGLTNREIGQQLYLSHRTVSTHLYRVFRKLGITARGQLRDALRDRHGR
ncbi:helix-turn-helix transcriptional regulator [Nonomuraea zeae]|uniref:helix-turn-helix transcriptional regulator n=1 Tax=Nonomuraea zeae TaxID=1642303 RepID=UPI00197E099D|nr:LuxR family transcriptional regulator [Nonomuraea zeae]